MRKLKYIASTFVLLSIVSLSALSQVEKKDLILNPGYHNDNNHLQYLTASTKAKIDGKFKPVPGINVSFYISEKSAANFLGKATTNDKGLTFVFIPPSAQREWNKTAKPVFVVVSEPTNLYDPTTSDLNVIKAKIKIDTSSDKKVIATLLELKDSVWAPVKGVDIKVAVKRLGGDLSVNETPTYTTDSLGVVSADFKRDSLPGDSAGNLILIAKVEDNDTYGNLSTEKIVPWGSYHKYVSNFDKRTLFARRGRSPFWLEFMAYGTIIVVWGILLYLIRQILKLKRLGV